MGRLLILFLFFLFALTFSGVQREETEFNKKNSELSPQETDIFHFWLPENNTNPTPSILPDENIPQPLENITPTEPLTGPGVIEVPPVATPPEANATSTESSPLPEALPQNITNIPTPEEQAPIPAQNITEEPEHTPPQVNTQELPKDQLPAELISDIINLETVDLQKRNQNIVVEFNLFNNSNTPLKGSIHFYLVKKGFTPEIFSNISATYNFRNQVAKNYVLPLSTAGQKAMTVEGIKDLYLMVDIYDETTMISRILIPFETHAN